MALPRKVKIFSSIVIVAVVATGIFLRNHNESDASRQSTDDAYVRADFTLVAPRVNGQITRVLVDDNETVKAGQLLAEIDDRDFRVAVQGAKADVMAAQAAISSLKSQIKRQESVIR